MELELRASFIFYSSYYEAISELPPDEQGQIYKAIIDYGIAKIEPTNLTPAGKMCFKLIKPTIDAALSRYDANVKNGTKGGRPKKETQTKPNNNPSETQTKPTENPTITQEQSENEPSENLNKDIDMDMDVDKDMDKNFKLVNKNKFNYEYQETCGRVCVRTPQERKPYLDFYNEYFNWCFNENFKQYGYEVIDTMIEAREQAIVMGLKFNNKTIGGKEFTNIITNVDVEQFRGIVKQLAFNYEIKNRPYYILGCIMYAKDDKRNRMTKEQMDTFIKEMEAK